MADKNKVGKRKPGRPKITTGERLSRTLAFRVTYKEDLGIRANAKAAGVEVTDYLRSLVRRDLEPKLHVLTPPPPPV